MRVLHVGKFFPPHRGGMETHLEALTRGLSPKVDVCVVVASDDSRTLTEQVSGFPLTRVGSIATVAGTSITPRLVSAIRSSPAEIVHLHWPNPAAVLAFMASGHRGRLVLTYHSDVIRQRVLSVFFNPFLNRTLECCDAIIATSPNYVETSAVLSRYRKKCVVLPFAVSDRAFSPADPDSISEVRRRYSAPLLLAVGRLVYYKGFEYLIRAMADVPGTLVIVGEGPLRTSLEQLIESLGLRNRVFIVAGVNDEELHNLYAASDLFVMPSIARSEAFGLVQAEAMAAGVPVINTQLDSGVPFVSQHGITGLTVPPADTGSLRDAILALLGNYSLRRQYGAAARKRAESQFRTAPMVDATLSLYEDVVRSHVTKRQCSQQSA